MYIPVLYVLLYGADRAALCISLYCVFFCMVPIALHCVYPCTVCSSVWCQSLCIMYTPVLYVLLYGTDRAALCISLYYMFFRMVPIALQYVYPCTVCSSVWCRSRCIMYIPVLYVLYGANRSALCIPLYYMFFRMVPIALQYVYPCTVCSSVWCRSRYIMYIPVLYVLLYGADMRGPVSI